MLGNRNITLCKELTKLHEQAKRTTLQNAIEHYSSHSPKGEFVLVLEGADSEQIDASIREQWQSMSIEDHMKLYLDKNIPKKEAMKLVAKDRGVSKRDIYQALLECE